ncbi:uncharacterized protein LOC143910977 isoform X2 [Arctopsyche grandis]
MENIDIKISEAVEDSCDKENISLEDVSIKDIDVKTRTLSESLNRTVNTQCGLWRGEEEDGGDILVFMNLPSPVPLDDVDFPANIVDVWIEEIPGKLLPDNQVNIYYLLRVSVWWSYYGMPFIVYFIYFIEIHTYVHMYEVTIVLFCVLMLRLLKLFFLNKIPIVFDLTILLDHKFISYFKFGLDLAV